MRAHTVDPVVTLAAGLPPEERAFQVALRLHEDLGVSLARFREVARTSRARRSFCFLVEDHLERMTAHHPVAAAQPDRSDHLPRSVPPAVAFSRSVVA